MLFLKRTLEMKITMKLVFIAFSFFNCIGIAYFRENLIVRLSNGAVQGEKVTGERGNIFYSFRGIPFAEPPVGNLRFKPPVPKRPWKDLLIANKNGPSCPQISLATKSYVGDEDCLFLNVYTPKLPGTSDEKMNVIYYIHGGGFFEGTSFTYGAKRFRLENDIVLVTVNYRLATIGFLSTNDSAASGNYGLLDQTEGLRWVRNNIHYFGGDPNKVTIMGESAGSASVTFHMLSPLSEGLFRHAVAMSGTALNRWALQKDPLYWTKELGKKVNCPIDTTKELVDCLREKSAKELTEQGLIKANGVPPLTTVPTLDNYFIHDLPLNIIRNRKHHKDVSILLGTTKDEGNCWVPNSNKEFTDEEIKSVLKQTVEVLPDVSRKINLIKEKYFGDLPNNSDREEVLNRLRSAITDGMFQKLIFNTAKELIDSGTKTYLYKYDFEIPKFAPRGVCHADDLYMFFDRSNHKLNLDEKSLQMSQIFQRLIINFVKYGTPVPPDDKVDCNWPMCNRDHLSIYHINLNCSSVVYDEKKDPLYNFWVNEVNAV